ncbi:hypothetical protein P3L10_003266 [Capsicum annuum]
MDIFVVHRKKELESQKGIRVIDGFLPLLQFVWQPYSPDVFATLPDYCVNDSTVWRAIVPVIAWDVVEWHYPDRVLRQFELIQNISSKILWDPKHFQLNRRG